ncbi:hypothetical protein predicted by Glimmer/Critica [Sorangium cellulosum So ce56]|uniref:Uncharacterized protein n=1 Tax=Sorangium cellulosum (strain So ce56) TaxID=448385 RepID=A9GKE5_SORC5|nr:hypothetical protein predicted by Glimmer/Critica [Sorangium cellulosum So ce56]
MALCSMDSRGRPPRPDHHPALRGILGDLAPVFRARSDGDYDGCVNAKYVNGVNGAGGAGGVDGGDNVDGGDPAGRHTAARAARAALDAGC